MDRILGLIWVIIVVYAGMSLEPGISTTIATITTPTYSLGVVGLNTLVMPVSGIGIVWLVLTSMKKA